VLDTNTPPFNLLNADAVGKIGQSAKPMVGPVAAPVENK